MSEQLTREWYDEIGEREPDYIGDGVYVSLDAGSQIWLRVKRSGLLHEIALDSSTFAALVRYQQRTKAVAP